jgi:predicted phosphodiesterase
MTKIRVMSDLHQDGFAYKFKNPSTDEILILAGDTANSVKSLAKFLAYSSELFKSVIVIFGNHEYYKGTEYSKIETELIQKLAELTSATNIHILNKNTITLDNITFIGATLWTNFRRDPPSPIEAKKWVYDFVLMKLNCDELVTPSWMAQKCKEEMQYIRNQCNSISGKKVVITHFPPILEFAHPKWGTLSQNPLNAYFINDLYHELEDLEFSVWICGHTHDSKTFKIEDKQFICNPRGYRHEFADFNDELIIEL